MITDKEPTMLKRKGDITSIETPPHFNPIVFSTNKIAADRINSIASFLLNDVEDMEHHISILYDKNGKEIYEGDIILYGGSIQHEVVFRHGAFGYLLYGGEFISYAGNTNFTFNPLNRSKEHEVIGNIYDNPELRQTQYDDTTTIH